MKTNVLFSTFLLAACVDTVAASEIELLGVYDAEKHKLTLTISNATNVKYCLRNFDFSEDSSRNMFRIIRDGSPIQYIGPLHTSFDVSTWIEVEPNSSITETWFLDKYYNLSSDTRYSLNVSIPVTDCRFAKTSDSPIPTAHTLFALVGKPDFSDWSQRIKSVNDMSENWVKHGKWLELSILK